MYNQKITSKIEIAKLEQKFCINYPEGFSIYNLYELSNQRIAAYGDYILKIYSLKTGRFITEIKLDSIINKITELKNKDILICSNNIIYFYKLLPNKHYGLYKIIDESKQGTYNKRLFSDEEYFDLFSVYELMNGNLLSCSSYGIKIYEKNIDEHYKLSFIKQINKPITKAVEIKKNLFILFSHDDESCSPTLGICNLTILKYDYEKDELTELNGCLATDRSWRSDFLRHISYEINNNHLFIRYGFNLDIYDINQDVYKTMKNTKVDFEEIICNFDDDKVVVKTHDGIFKIVRYKDYSFQDLKIFPFVQEFSRGILKLRDNNFIIYYGNKIIILKNLE